MTDATKIIDSILENEPADAVAIFQEMVKTRARDMVMSQLAPIAEAKDEDEDKDDDKDDDDKDGDDDDKKDKDDDCDDKKKMDEGVSIDHSRYKASHGKNPNFKEGAWAFTHKPLGSGDIDLQDPNQVLWTKHGDDPQKVAKEWAKKNGHSRVYTMESIVRD